MVYTFWKKWRKTTFRLNNIILTKVKLQSINDVALTGRASNKLCGDAISLSDAYISDDTNNGVTENVFRGKN